VIVAANVNVLGLVFAVENANANVPLFVRR
jgi:hypothetical protein